MKRIGFVGLGHMGLPMARNLIKSGHTVTGFDLQPNALAVFAEAGGIVAKSLETLAENQDVIITMLQTGQQVEHVCLGNSGLFAHANKNTLHIDCSTIDVQSAHNIHHQASLFNLFSVDAPVSGGVAGAAAATLTFMVGGTSEAYHAAEKILINLGKKIIHTGDAGSGQAAKICNNMILGVSMIAVSEAFELAKQLGLSPKKLHEVVTNASGQCWVMNQYVPVPGVLEHAPANHHYEPGFTTAMMLKDLWLSQYSAEAMKVTTPMGALATKLYQKAQEAGMGELDFSVIIKQLAE
ncbi:MAG: 3-hydroxyisobutyrate dehydrogenase [Legionellaceae bacterium]|nr:3-hydroxyisobutyrate dehydrogenase [Legionellaceae bacterium]